MPKFDIPVDDSRVIRKGRLSMRQLKQSHYLVRFPSGQLKAQPWTGHARTSVMLAVTEANPFGQVAECSGFGDLAANGEAWAQLFAAAPGLLELAGRVAMLKPGDTIGAGMLTSLITEARILMLEAGAVL